MTRGESETFKIGEVRYWCLMGPDDPAPWLSSVRLVSLSPKGRRACWEAVDPPDKCWLPETVRGCHPWASAIEAVVEFQRSSAMAWYFKDAPLALDECIRRVILAERLKGELLQESGTVPIHAAASTG